MTGLLSRAASAWTLYFFTPASASDLGLNRVLFCTLAFLYYVTQDFGEWGTVAPEFWMPIPLFKVLALPLLPAAAINAIELTFKVALAFAAIGLFTRAALWLMLACSVYLLGLPHNFGQIQHFDTLVVLVCAILAFSRASDAWSVDAWLSARRGHRPPAASGEYTWPIRAIRVMTAVIFFSAGFAKLRRSGLNWIFSDHLAIILVRHQYYVSDGEPLTSWGPAIAAHPWLARTFAAISVATEVLYPLALFSTRARLLLVPAGIGFLVGIRLLMGPTFEPFVMCSVFWVPWTAVLARLRELMPASHRGTQPAPATDFGAGAPVAASVSRTTASTTSRMTPP